jgi:hypothetical protein
MIEEKFKGIIKKEDMETYKAALSHFRRIFYLFENDEVDSIEKSKRMETKNNLKIVLDGIDELIEHTLSDKEFFGLGKKTVSKVKFYMDIVNSAFNQFSYDLSRIEIKLEMINGDFDFDINEVDYAREIRYLKIEVTGVQIFYGFFSTKCIVLHDLAKIMDEYGLARTHFAGLWEVKND